MGTEISFCVNATVELHLISWSKKKTPAKRDWAFNDHSASKVLDEQIDCSPHSGRGSHLINSIMPHMQPTRKQREKRERHAGGTTCML